MNETDVRVGRKRAPGAATKAPAARVAARAALVRLTVVTGRGNASQPALSPTGARLAFVRDCGKRRSTAPSHRRCRQARKTRIRRSLKYMRAFTTAWPDCTIVQGAIAQLPDGRRESSGSSPRAGTTNRPNLRSQSVTSNGRGSQAGFAGPAHSSSLLSMTGVQSRQLYCENVASLRLGSTSRRRS